MGSLDKRIQQLEELYASSAGQGERAEAAREQRREIFAAILDELAGLKARRAHGYRGGNPAHPTDPTGDALGYPYTHGEAAEFAVRRAVERLDFSPDERQEIITTWVAGLRSLSRDRWDEVAAEGPPEPTPPWGARRSLRRQRREDPF